MDRNLAEGLQVGAASRFSDFLPPDSIPVPPTNLAEYLPPATAAGRTEVVQICFLSRRTRLPLDRLRLAGDIRRRPIVGAGACMDRIDALKIFVRVVESGSFSAVARELGVGQPTVSKQVAALERRLGADLLLRSTRKVSLTEAGRDFFDSASKLMADLDAAESRVGRGLRSPSGPVRVSVAPSFGALYVVPRLPEFFRRYPDVSVEVLASDRSANLIEDGIDVAIRNGELTESSLIARKIGTTPIVVIGSPGYLEEHGEPTKPGDLDRHRCIVFSSQSGPRPWLFSGRDGHVSYLPEARFRTNDGEQIRTAVLTGVGLAQVPHWLCARELEAGSLRRVLRRYEPSALQISAVRPASRRPATRVIAFIDFLAETLAAHRDAP